MTALPHVTKQDLLDAIRQGVREAISGALPKNLLGEPHPAAITNAITDGVAEAMQVRR